MINFVVCDYVYFLLFFISDYVYFLLIFNSFVLGLVGVVRVIWFFEVFGYGVVF